MRKCPNCKKAIPVGAKKCIHCRASVVDYESQDGSGSWDNEVARNNTTAFGRPNSGNSLNPIDAGGRGYGGVGGRMGSSNSYDRISGISSHVSSSGSFGRAGSGFNTPMSGSYGRISGSYGRANSSSYDEAPHNTMLGLGPIAAPSARDFYDDDGGSGNRGSNTIAGMPGIKFDMNRRQAMEQDALIGAGSSAATPPASNPVPKPLDISAPKVEDKPEDDPFAGLPGVAPAPSSLVDEEFDDLTAKLFGDEFAAGGNDVGDEEGFDFDFTEEPEEPAKIEKPVESEKSIEEILNAPAPKKEPAEETKKEEALKAEKSEEKPAEEKPAEKAVAAKEEAPKKDIVKAEPSLLDKVAPIASIVAAVLSLSWLVAIPEGGKIGLAIVVSLLAVGVDVASIKFAPKIKNTGLLVAFLVCVVLLFVAMAGMPAGSMAKTLMVCASVAQLVCGLIYYSRKY